MSIGQSSASKKGDVTRLLKAWSRGDAGALDQLMPVVYDELCRIAAAYRVDERPGQTLLTRDLVHEAYLRLTGGERVDWRSRSHFYGIAARLMRQILVDRARRRHAKKRGEGRDLALEEALTVAARPHPGLLELDEALRRLSEIDSRQARIVELRFFGGYSIEETAAFADLSPATVKREWMMAKAWLGRELSAGGER